MPDRAERRAELTASFDEFYRSSNRRVLHVVYALTGDLAEAQDCVAEAYARAWQRWPGMRDVEQPEAWVITVARRIAVSRWRRTMTARRHLRREGPPATAPPPNEDHVALIDALRRIPEPQRHAVVLHHLVGRTVDEIAAETGARPGTVKARLHRGRAALAAVLAPEPDPPSGPPDEPATITDPFANDDPAQEAHHG